MKFRQPGQGTTDEIKRRDLRLELERAEKKAKVGGSTIDEAAPADQSEAAADDEEAQQAAKRRKILADAVALDKDDSDDDDEDRPRADGEGAEDEEDSDDDSDDEDDEAALMRELEKIRRERAEEKARQVREPL